METFTLTEKHLKLLRRMYVGWQDCETGAPEIDPKRPYGNSSVARDVAEILDEEYNEENGLSNESEKELLKLHGQTETALQIVLVTGEFKPGEFEKTDEYGRRSWRRVGP
jgi:hypothetical protein